MASNVTLLSLRNQARERADMKDSEFWADADITVAVNASLKRLYNLLISAWGDEYFVTSELVASVADQETYSLNAAFYKLLGIDVGSGASPTDFFRLTKFSFAERNTRRDNNFGLHDFRYRLHGSTFKVIPTSPAGNTFKVWYIPAMTELVADVDTFDGINGFEEWVVLDVAMKMLRKEESDTQELQLDQQKMEKHIIDMASPRDAAEPESVVDVENIDRDEYYDWWIRRN